MDEAKQLRWPGLRALSFLLAIFLTASFPVLGNTVVSSMPASFAPGVSITVTDSVFPDSSVFVYAVEDTVPLGWSVSNVNNSGGFDAVSHAVKWGPFFDNQSRELTYVATPPVNAAATAIFSGDATFNLSDPIPIVGRRFISLHATVTNAIICSMPETFFPGASFGVTNSVTPIPGTSAYAVEDQVPQGWDALDVSDGGVFDPATRTVKWGPFFEGASRQLTYVAVAPSNAVTAVVFEGTGNFDGAEVTIAGRREVQPSFVNVGAAVSSFSPQVPRRVIGSL